MEIAGLNIGLSQIFYILGLVAILVEITVGFVGFIFLSLGLIFTGLFIDLEIISGSDNFTSQILSVLSLTFFWAIILWKPLKKFKLGKGEKFNDVVGTTAEIFDDNGIEKGKAGNVKWSGALMRAKIADNSDKTSFSKGDIVKIIDKTDGILIIDSE